MLWLFSLWSIISFDRRALFSWLREVDGGKFAEVFSCGCIISLCRFNFRIKFAQVNQFSSNSDLCFKSSAWTGTYALVPRRTLSFSSIAAILFGCSSTKIGASIVQAIVVAVVCPWS